MTDIGKRFAYREHVYTPGEPVRPVEVAKKGPPRSQQVRIRRLADELYGDIDGNLDGHEWYEREIGKPFSKLTVEEGRRIAAELSAEFEEQEEANVRFAS